MKVLQKILVCFTGLTCLLWTKVALGQDTDYQVNAGGQMQLLENVSTWAISQDTTLVFLAGPNSIRIYDVESGKLLNTISKVEYKPGPRPNRNFISQMLAPKGNRELYCLANEEILKYSLPEGKLLWQLPVREKYRAMLLCDDGQRLFTIGSERHGQKLMQVNIHTGKPQYVYHKGISLRTANLFMDDKWRPECPAIRPDGSVIAVANTAQDVVEIYLSDKSKKWKIPIYMDQYALSMSVHPFKPELALLTLDSAYVYDWERSEKLLQAPLGSNLRKWEDNKLAYTPDGKQLICVRTIDSAGKQWVIQHNLSTEGYKETDRRYLEDFPELPDSHPLTYIEESEEDGQYRLSLYNLLDKKQIFSRSFSVSKPAKLLKTIVSPRGRWTAIMTNREWILWDNAKGAPVRYLSLPDALQKGYKYSSIWFTTAKIYAQPQLEFSANDSFLAVGYRKIEVLDCFAGGRTIYKDSAMLFCFNPQRNDLAILSGEELRSINFRSGRILYKKEVLLLKRNEVDYNYEVSPQIAFSNDGNYIILSSIQRRPDPSNRNGSSPWLSVRRIEAATAKPVDTIEISASDPYELVITGDTIFIMEWGKIHAHSYKTKRTVSAEIGNAVNWLDHISLAGDSKTLIVEYWDNRKFQKAYGLYRFNGSRLVKGKTLYGDKGEAESRALTHNNAVLFDLSVNPTLNSLEFRSVKNTNLLLSLCFPDSASWVAYTPDGYVDFSENARKWIHINKDYRPAPDNNRLIDERRKSGLFRERVSTGH